VRERDLGLVTGNHRRDVAMYCSRGSSIALLGAVGFRSAHWTEVQM